MSGPDGSGGGGYGRSPSQRWPPASILPCPGSDFDVAGLPNCIRAIASRSLNVRNPPPNCDVPARDPQYPLTSTRDIDRGLKCAISSHSPTEWRTAELVPPGDRHRPGISMASRLMARLVSPRKSDQLLWMPPRNSGLATNWHPLAPLIGSRRGGFDAVGARSSKTSRDPSR